VSFGATKNINYIYDASGTKLKKVVNDNGMITTTDYAGNFIYENNVLQFFNQPEGYVEPINASDYNQGFNYVYQYKDHLGNIRLSYKNISLTSTPSLQLVEENNYYPFGLKHKGYNTAINGTHHKYMFGGKEFDESFQTLNTYDFGARNYDPALGRWMNIDPLAEQMRRHSPYNYAFDNPIYFIDPDGMSPDIYNGGLVRNKKDLENSIENGFGKNDWVEKQDKSIVWDDKVTSANDKDLQAGDKYLGKNVLVGTHNRDASGNEPINTATFDLYLESDKTGPSATINGNTVPADITKQGTLAEGLYSARSQGRAGILAEGKQDLALIINEGKSVPTAPGSPKSSMSEIFFHSGNYNRLSLSTSTPGQYISKGCQTSGCGPGSRPLHNQFMKAVGTDFKGSYYLRSQPKLEVPKSK